MKLCAIILNYRGAERTRACLQSLIGQGIDLAIVVDNSADDLASRDLTIALADMQRMDANFPIHTLRPSDNLGFAKGVNFALNHSIAADCDYFLLINNDALAHPGMLAGMLKTLHGDAADLVAPTILNTSGLTQASLHYQRHFGLLTSRKTAFSFPYLSGCCLLFRRELHSTGRFFDEDFFMYGEDTLLGWRLARAGKTISVSQEARVTHIGRASSQEHSLFYEYHMARAHALLAMKTHYSPLEIPLLLITKLLALSCRALLRSIRYRSFVPIHAFFLAWRALPIRAKK